MANHQFIALTATSKATLSIISTLLLILALTLFTGCRSNEDITLTSIPVTIPIPVLTATRCPCVTAIPTPTLQSNRLIYFLVDRSGSYDEHTGRALEIIEQVLPEVISNGDSLVVGWIGDRSAGLASVYFSGSVPTVEVPTLIPVPPTLTPTQTPSPTPSPPPSPTPIPTPVLNLSMGRRHVTQTAQASATQAYIATQVYIATQAYAAAEATDYNCLLDDVNMANQEMLATQQCEAQRAIQGFLDSTEPIFLAATPESDMVTQIHEALYLASETFQDALETSQYQTFTLVIFSDMLETGSLSLGGAQLNFSGVDVIIVLYCEEAATCERLKDTWERTFYNAGAQSVEALLLQQLPEGNPRALIDLLVR